MFTTDNLPPVIPKRLEFLTSPDLPPARLARIFVEAGEELFLVGGSVRDAFLDREVTDYDFATSAHPPRVVELLSGWADAVFEVGAAFGTVGAIKDGHSIEITTFRQEVYRNESRKPKVTYSDNIETDL
ncbi:MAG TPA: hypothetical protein EYP73_01310, partial [Acidimicrobiia bacterium]|nr:hypothetical protein [Acidimicrobiia bacterium]